MKIQHILILQSKVAILGKKTLKNLRMCNFCSIFAV